MKNNYKVFHAFALNNKFKLAFGTGFLILLAVVLTINGTTVTEDCSNGIDDDGDGLVDCLDPDCVSAFNCLMGENMELFETSNWSSAGSGSYAGTAGTVNINVSGTVNKSNGSFLATPNGAYNNADLWISDLKNHTSFEVLFTWDNEPESSISDIDDLEDDKSGGEITFTFSEPVTNPVLHIDRLGGSGHIVGSTNYPDTISNSIKLTLQNAGISLVKVAGTEDFETTSTTIRRTPDIITTHNIESNNDKNIGTAAGSVVLLGTFSSVTFDWVAEGVEGVGGDGVEFIWSLNLPGAFPVEWLGIDAKWQGTAGIVNWQTATEENVAAFIVERKTGEQVDFEDVGEVEAAGFSNSVKEYSFSDEQAAFKANGDPLYYRIKQIDFDGKFDYSDVVELQSTQKGLTLKLFPNPATDLVNLEITKSDQLAPTKIMVFNTAGQAVLSESVSPDQNTFQWDVSSWASGTYIIKVNNRATNATEKLIVR